MPRPGGRICLSDPDWQTNIFDTPDGHSEQFLSVEHASPQNPTMGRQLYRLSKDVRLVDIDIDTWTVTSTEFAFIKEDAELDTWTAAMQAAGKATATEVQEWLEGLQKADKQGVLFGSITGFTITGTVPDS